MLVQWIVGIAAVGLAALVVFLIVKRRKGQDSGDFEEFFKENEKKR